MVLITFVGVEVYEFNETNFPLHGFSAQITEKKQIPVGH